ncbi:ATP-binding response regulator [Methylopila sp. Yamaguchi]|uniref:ATP-binding response regulator n=1 Tax=Methylopila sp. Yamaguchi TaxID=1437817 RepID=UPI000CBDA6E7|nr:ATP-binding protein [Methylopila sp. Yamaguchi]GBD48479.1 signal transduction histidine kinase [Methylopila sp. Yamaguchi]
MADGDGAAETDPGRVFAGFDALPNGAAVWDEAGALLFANRAFRQSFDFALPVGLPYARFLTAVAASREWRLPVPPDIWITEQAAAFGEESEADYKSADGRVVRMSVAPIDGGGAATMLSDVTAAERREATLLAAKEKAEAVDEAKSRFLRAANHDLRQPLAALKIMIFNCMRETDDARRRDLLHGMDVSVSVMEDLLGALLQIGQLDAGRIKPRIATFQLSTLFERLEIQFRHQAADKGLRLRIVGARAAVSSDRALLERILSNIVANALRFTDVGGVLVGCRRRGDGLRIDVVDTGRGVAPEDQERIFDEFFRAADDRRLEKTGLGLGLNIVKRLSDLLGHRIQLQSAPGVGSRFSVFVPLGNVWHSEVVETEVNEAVAGEFVGAPILLVEDDDALREAMGQLLDRWGVDRRSAAGAEEAAAIVAGGFRPRLIIADYSIRKSTGLDVIAHVRGVSEAEIPACIITADAEPGVVERVRAASLPLMVKPVSPPRLRVMMHHLLFEQDPA